MLASSTTADLVPPFQGVLALVAGLVLYGLWKDPNIRFVAAIRWRIREWWVELAVAISLGIFTSADVALASGGAYAGLYYASTRPKVWAWARRWRSCDDNSKRAIGKLALALLDGHKEFVDWHRRRRTARIWNAVQRKVNVRARIKKLTYTPAGLRLSVEFAAGKHADHLARYEREIASMFRALPGGVRVHADSDDARRGVVFITKRDPLTTATPLPAPAGNIFARVPIGIDENGNVVALKMVERSLLIGGIMGFGKSSLLQIPTAHAAADPTARLMIIDGKADTKDWAPRCDRWVDDIDGAIEILETADRWWKQRKAHLDALGRRAVAPGEETLTLVIDEMLTFSDWPDKRKRDRFNGLLAEILRRSRAYGLVVIATAINPQAKNLPTRTRDLFAHRIALRCTSPQMSDTILGAGSAADNADASKMVTEPAVALTFTEGDTAPRRFRVYSLGDSNEEIDANIKALAAASPPKPPYGAATLESGSSVHPVSEPEGEPVGARAPGAVSLGNMAHGEVGARPAQPVPAHVAGMNGHGHGGNSGPTSHVVSNGKALEGDELEAAIEKALRAGGEGEQKIADRLETTRAAVRKVRARLTALGEL